MKLTLLALILLAFPAFAGDRSVSSQLYLEELQYEIEIVHVKRSLGQSTDYDEFMLVKMTERLNQMGAEYISRAMFTPGIVNKEPSAMISSAPQNAQVFFFTELRNLAGRQVDHVWLVNGVPVHRISFNVGADRWRTYSSISTRNAPSFEVLVYVDGYLLTSKTLNIR